MSELDFPDIDSNIFDEDSGKEDGEVNKQASFKRFEIHEGIMFCIELSEHMFEVQDELDGKSQIEVILTSLSELMELLIVTRPSTAIGCYFYNCEREDSKESIFEFIPLVDLNVQWMKKVNDLLEDVSNQRITFKEYLNYNIDQNKKLNIPILLEKLFSLILETFNRNIEGQKEFNSKKVFLFTDNDLPNVESQQRSIDVLKGILKDIDDNMINFTNFFISKKDKPFNPAFYSKVLRNDRNYNSLGSQAYFGPSTKPIGVNDIKERIFQRKEIRRVVFQCPLVLDEGTNFVISIKGYSIFNHEKGSVRYKLVYENQEIRKEAFSKRKFINPKTGEDVSKQTVKIIPYGEKEIEMEDKNIANALNVYGNTSASLTVIGFLNEDNSLVFYNNIDKTLFITPDENVIEGSFTAFASLFRTLKKLKKVGVVWGSTKSNSSPSLYLLWPSKDDDNNQGFYLTKVPFIDEIRKYPTLSNININEEWEEYKNVKELTQGIISHFNLKSGYHAEEFRNPALNRHYKLLHDYLLQVEIPQDDNDIRDRYLREDDTLLKITKIRERIMKDTTIDDVEKRRLSKYLEVWNIYYRKFKEDTNQTSSSLLKSEKKPKLNL
ncbi:ATP-dependent DNA helicase II subunit 1 [Nakaseomyces glabratus]|uniref:ATP-dependent DNA helicase II subunit 1 n=1 Tax=Candida glabrata TaxID=5478 RepID=A0A0W0CPT0_CANGB|nr:ATP-dependent DNA helicase II subunit 1 [Nakaseomyces glabratus]KTB05513.1 ATP-dependent DNA helicase II subunit 1 [Nakaseomyces glabratus]KTB05805.1 ATP-dependent DNA helicase II subunit 1 [Nakaseomyces glabratus]KTB12980.1 ATP-dependent DNA helicase II subunit 1 [Nakaseomyces glabratus]